MSDKIFSSTDWEVMKSVTTGELFDIIDEISDEIEKAEEVDYLKCLHYLYSFSYRITMIVLNHRIAMLSSDCWKLNIDISSYFGIAEKVSRRVEEIYPSKSIIEKIEERLKTYRKERLQTGETMLPCCFRDDEDGMIHGK